MLIDKQIIAEICGHRCIYSIDGLCPDCCGKKAMQDIKDIIALPGLGGKRWTLNEEVKDEGNTINH